MTERKFENDCDNCGKGSICCEKNCFKDNDTNLFRQLTGQELEFLVDEKQQISYNAKETIIKQNTTSTFVVCMRNGLAKVYVEGEKGKNLIVKIISKGDFISGGGLFNGNVQHFTIAAITPVHCALPS